MSDNHNDGLDDFSAGMTEMANSAQQENPVVAKQPPLPPPPTPAVARKGNEVFSSPQMTQQPRSNNPIESINHADVAMREFGYEIPIDAVPLPSKGLIYPANHPLHLADSVEYRGMTAKQEDILMTPALIKKGTVISELIRSCLVDRRINVGSLISGDRNAMMIAIRISGYGREYKPTFECPRCDHKNEQEYDLAELNLKPLKIKPVMEGENLFNLHLPVSKATVGFKFLTGTEEEMIIQEAEIKKKKGIQNTNLVTSRLSRSIVSINGDTSVARINKFVDVMPARDSLVLRKYIDENEPGVDMEVEFTCSNCDYYEKIQLPMNSSFFWPKS